MIEIKNFDTLRGMYLERIEGTQDWYFCTKDNYDAFDAWECVTQYDGFPGMRRCLIHFPDGQVFEPFPQRENLYIGEPVYDNGALGLLTADFDVQSIYIYRYEPLSNQMEQLVELPLSVAGDCYNLMLQTSPVTLTRHTQDCEVHILWPEHSVFSISPAESVRFRDGDKVYGTEWFEDPDRDEVVVRDIHTGKVLDRLDGDLFRMPDGTLWRL